MTQSPCLAHIPLAAVSSGLPVPKLILDDLQDTILIAMEDALTQALEEDLAMESASKGDATETVLQSI